MSIFRERLLKLTELRFRNLPLLFDNLKDANDNVGIILKCHLFTEAMLEDLIRLALENHADAVLSLNLSYAQKLELAGRLRLVEDWELLPSYVIGSLRKLNKLRNRIAHRLGTTVGGEDIHELFVGLEAELPYEIPDSDTQLAMRRYLAFIYGYMLPKYEQIQDET